MKAKTNWHWQCHGIINNDMVSSLTIVHPCLEVSSKKNVADIPRSIYNKKLSGQDVQRQPFYIADTYHDYILDEIDHRDHIKYRIQKHNDDK